MRVQWVDFRSVLFNLFLLFLVFALPLAAQNSSSSESKLAAAASTQVQIQSPASGFFFALSADNAPQTQLNFTATGAGQINWQATLEYHTQGTSGQLSVPNDVRNFASASGKNHTESYRSMGGRLTAAAALSPKSPSTSVQGYMTGSFISQQQITQALRNAYSGGTTPNLLTGIATQESGYRQFCIPGQSRTDVCLGGQRPLFGQIAYWPHESGGNGSHIGLMQVPLSMTAAWDWNQNVLQGASIYRGKLDTATRLVSTIRSSHPGLRQLNSLELENMALVLYGPAASGDLNRQYYIPVCNGTVSGQQCRNGVWNWRENSAGNSNGVSYANSCRSKVKNN